MAEKDDYLLDSLLDLHAKSTPPLTGEIIAQARKTRDEKNNGKGAVDILVEQGLITEDDVAKAKAAHFGAEFITKLEPEMDALVAVPGKLARQFTVIPISLKKGAGILLAVSDPSDLAMLEVLHRSVKHDITLCVASESKIRDLIDLWYPDQESSPNIQLNARVLGYVAENFLDELITYVAQQRGYGVHPTVVGYTIGCSLNQMQMLIGEGHLTYIDVRNFMADRAGMDTIDFDEIAPLRQIAERITIDQAYRYMALPLALSERAAEIVICDTMDVSARDSLEELLRRTLPKLDSALIAWRVASLPDMWQAIDKYYGPQTRRASVRSPHQNPDAEVKTTSTVLA